jgi:hybrid cluster-associated redox disulfide protein
MKFSSMKTRIITSKITSKMIVADVLKQWPQTIPVFQKYQLGCVGCVMAPFETLEEAAAIYQISLFKFLEDLQIAQGSEITKKFIIHTQYV